MCTTPPPKIKKKKKKLGPFCTTHKNSKKRVCLSLKKDHCLICNNILWRAKYLALEESFWIWAYLNHWIWIWTLLNLPMIVLYHYNRRPASMHYFLSPPVLMHDGLQGITFCLFVHPSVQVTRKNHQKTWAAASVIFRVSQTGNESARWQTDGQTLPSPIISLLR